MFAKLFESQRLKYLFIEIFFSQIGIVYQKLSGRYKFYRMLANELN